MRSTCSALICSLAFLAAATTANAQPQAPTGSWSNEQGGQNFYYGAMVSDNTYFYVIGGYQIGNINQAPFYMAQCNRYDPANNSWLTLPQIAAGTANGDAVWGTIYPAGAYHNGRLFLFGGLVYTGAVGSANYSGAYSNAIRVFDMSSQTWSTLSATINGTRYFHRAAMTPTALGDRIYITGGYDTTSGYSPNNDEFNPANNTVTARAALPNNTGLYIHAMAANPGTYKVYVMGGLLAGAQSALCYEYTPPDNDPNSPDNVWTVKTPITIGGVPQTRYYSAAATLNGRIYLFGGYAGGAISSTTVEYNPASDTWAQRASMSNSRYIHGAAAVGNYGYVYGGPSTPTSNEEFTPPDFGVPPNAPTQVAQAGSRAESAMQSNADPNQFDGWTNNQVSFSANITDPNLIQNVPQQVRLRVQVKSQGSPWTQASAVTSLATGFAAQGTHTIGYNIPADGGYDWRWRVEDNYFNSYPNALEGTPQGWVEAFENAVSPDFRSDQAPPSDPVADAPHNIDIQSPDPNTGDIVLNWIESTDNGPVAGISYEIQVAREGGFGDIEAQLFSTAGVSSYPITLSVSRYPKFWRMRARDVGANFSHWSNVRTFRVTYNDGLNHSSGDAKRNCGFMVGSGATSLIVGLLGLALIAQGGRRRFRM